MAGRVFALATAEIAAHGDDAGAGAEKARSQTVDAPSHLDRRGAAPAPQPVLTRQARGGSS